MQFSEKVEKTQVKGESTYIKAESSLQPELYRLAAPVKKGGWGPAFWTRLLQELATRMIREYGSPEAAFEAAREAGGAHLEFVVEASSKRKK